MVCQIQPALLVLWLLTHPLVLTHLQAARVKSGLAIRSLHHLQDTTEREEKTPSSSSVLAPACTRMKPPFRHLARAWTSPSRASTRFCCQSKTTVGSNFSPQTTECIRPSWKRQVTRCHSASSQPSGPRLLLCPLGRFYLKSTPLQVPMFQLKFNKSRFNWKWKINRLNSAPIKPRGVQADEGLNLRLEGPFPHAHLSLGLKRLFWFVVFFSDT